MARRYNSGQVAGYDGQPVYGAVSELSGDRFDGHMSRVRFTDTEAGRFGPYSWTFGSRTSVPRSSGSGSQIDGIGWTIDPGTNEYAVSAWVKIPNLGDPPSGYTASNTADLVLWAATPHPTVANTVGNIHGVGWSWDSGSWTFLAGNDWYGYFEEYPVTLPANEWFRLQMRQTSSGAVHIQETRGTTTNVLLSTTPGLVPFARHVGALGCWNPFLLTRTTIADKVYVSGLNLDDASGSSHMPDVYGFHDEPISLNAGADMSVSADVIPASESSGLPAITVEAAIGQSMADGPDVLSWTDLTQYVRAGAGLTAGRGRLTPSATASGGQLTVTLDNNDGRFTPTTSDGPYGDGFAVRTPIRVRRESGAPLWTGYVTDIKWNASDGDYVVQVAASDMLGLLARTDLTGGYPVEWKALERNTAGANLLGLWAFDAEDNGQPSQRVRAIEGKDGVIAESYRTLPAQRPLFASGLENSGPSPEVKVTSLTADDFAGYAATLPVTNPPDGNGYGTSQTRTGYGVFHTVINLSDISYLSGDEPYVLAKFGLANYSNQTIWTATRDNEPAGIARTLQSYLGMLVAVCNEPGKVKIGYRMRTQWPQLHNETEPETLVGYWVISLADHNEGWINLALVDGCDYEGDFVSGFSAPAKMMPTLYVDGEKAENLAPYDVDAQAIGNLGQPFVSTRWDTATNPLAWAASPFLFSNPSTEAYDPGGSIVMLGDAGSDVGYDISYRARGDNATLTLRPFTGLVAFASCWHLDAASWGNAFEAEDFDDIDAFCSSLTSSWRKENYTARATRLAGLTAAGSWLAASDDGLYDITRQGLTDANLLALLQQAVAVEGGALLPLASGKIAVVSEPGRASSMPVLSLDAARDVLALSGVFSVDDSQRPDAATATLKPSGYVVEQNRAGVTAPLQVETLELQTDDKRVAKARAAARANKPNDADGPSLTVSLSHLAEVGKASAVLSLELGERVLVTNLPAAAGVDYVVFTVESITHQVSSTDWTIVLDLSPAYASGGVLVGDVVSGKVIS